ncbi:hypothetical protein GS489_00425 [Rhodococcus hoagii]|nr:hypothetical protein [Prescottella equi]
MTSPLPLAERLQVLFRVWHKSGADEQSSAHVAEAVTAAGHPVSAQQIDALRSGAQPTADEDLLSAIASHFNTPAAYLIDDNHQDLHEQLLLLELFRDENVNTIQLRGERTAADRRALLDVLGARKRAGGAAESGGDDCQEAAGRTT